MTFKRARKSHSRLQKIDANMSRPGSPVDNVDNSHPPEGSPVVVRRARFSFSGIDTSELERHLTAQDSDVDSAQFAVDFQLPYG